MPRLKIPSQLLDKYWINTGSGWWWWWWWMLILGKWLTLTLQVFNTMSGAKQSSVFTSVRCPFSVKCLQCSWCLPAALVSHSRKKIQATVRSPWSTSKPVFWKGRPHHTWKVLQRLAFLTRKPFTSILSKTQQTKVYSVSYDMAACDSSSVCLSLLGVGAADETCL